MSITGLSFLAIYFSGLLSSLLGRPIIGLFVYFLAFYAHPPSRWWGYGIPDLRWSLLAGMVTLLSIFIHGRKNHGWLAKTEVKILILFVIFVWVQNIWALNADAQLQYSLLVTKFLLLTYILYATVKTLNDLYGVIIVNVMGTAYYGWIGYTQHVAGRFENAGTPGMEDGNLLSLHMVPILISASYILLCKLSLKKYYLVPLIALTLNGIFLTESRGAIVSMALSAIIALLFVPKSQKKLFKRYFFIACIAGGVLIGPGLIERLDSTITEDGTTEKSAESRIVIIRAQWEMFKNENPIFGNGHRGTAILSPFYLDETYMTNASGRNQRGSHNLVMALLVDQGLIGLILFLLVPFILLSRLWKNRRFFTRFENLDDQDENTILLYIGLNISLISYWVATMGVNSLRLEIDFWYYALIGLTWPWIVNIKSKTAAI